MTTFGNHSAGHMRHRRETRRPVILTVDGKAAAAVRDTGPCHHRLDLAAQAEAAEGIRQGLEDVAAGRTRPARAVFDQLGSRHGIPR